MICPSCIHYRPVSQTQQIAPVCAWRPTNEQRAELAAILPAPVLSRALVMPAPGNVDACPQYAGVA